RRCLDSMLRRHDGAADEERDSSTDGDRLEENWSDLAERAQQVLGVAGAAVYARTGGQAEYRLAVVWISEAPIPSIPELLPAVLEEIIAGGAARVWPDLADEARLGLTGSTFYGSVRSLAIVPIYRDGETAGALCAFDPRPQALRQSDVEKMTAIAARTPLPHAVLRRTTSSAPMDRDTARAVIPRELARVRRDQLSLSVVLFAATPRAPHGAELPSPASV